MCVRAKRKGRPYTRSTFSAPGCAKLGTRRSHSEISAISDFRCTDEMWPKNRKTWANVPQLEKGKKKTGTL